MISREEWTGHQHFELNWWTENSDTFGEEYKQTHVYAPRMGLSGVQDGGRWPIYDMHGFNILDVGGGPVSLLLKTRGAGKMHIVDPCEYPAWTQERYEAAGIHVYRMPAEDFKVQNAQVTYDEAWCYNVLQHTIDPEKVVAMMRRKAKLVRWFEWIDMPPHEGHPHELKADLLDQWLGDGVGYHHVEDIHHPATITDPKPWFIGRASFGYRTA